MIYILRFTMKEIPVKTIINAHFKQYKLLQS
jgi:hypothetical protein